MKKVALLSFVVLLGAACGGSPKPAQTPEPTPGPADNAQQAPAPPPAEPPVATGNPRTDPMASADLDNLRLTDFLDLPTLQEIQDNFAAVANVKATITDAAGNIITQATPTKDFLVRQRAIADAEEKQDAEGRREEPLSPAR